MSLDEEALDRLRTAEDRQIRETEKIKNGEMAEDAAQKPFKKAVRDHLKDEFRQAESELREVLGYEKHIVGSEFLNEDDADDS